MGDTFYSALGVEADADRESIRAAYRQLVKEHHPDVSDDPEAPERFKRLTTARDVLLDEAERTRYDRLGHDAYVRRHVESPSWSAEASRRDDGPHPGAGETKPGERGTGTGGGRTTWLGDDASPDGRRSGRQSAEERRRARRHTGPGTYGGTGWQHASRVYRRADTEVEREPSRLKSLLDGARSVGPWLAVHFVFILSALATGWFTFTQADEAFELPMPAVAFGVLVIGLVVFLSVIHVVSQVYT